MSVTEIVEDMKEKIFRYENRFSVFFYRLAETIVFAYRNNDQVCHLSIASCIKNLLILISEYGEVPDTVNEFFSGLKTEQIRSVRFDDGNLRNNFQRSSSRMFKKLVNNDKDPLPYSILEICIKILFNCNKRKQIQEVLESFELLFQLYPKVGQMMSRSNFVERLKIIYLQHQNDLIISNLIVNLHRVLLFGQSAHRMELYYQGKCYTIFNKSTSDR